MCIRTRFLQLILFCCWGFSLLGQQTKQRIGNSEQLPVHSYRVFGKASDLLTDDAAFNVFSAALQKDLEADLRGYDIEDKTTLEKYYSSLMEIAVLKGEYDVAQSYLQKENVLQDKAGAKALAGLLEQPLIDARKAGPGQAQITFQGEFKQRLTVLPYETVQNDLKDMKSNFEINSANLLTGTIEALYDVLAQKIGAVSKDAAIDIVDNRFTIEELLPYKEFV